MTAAVHYLKCNSDDTESITDCSHSETGKKLFGVRPNTLSFCLKIVIH